MTDIGPLSWLRVVDLTDLRGAMCARILADLGAEVVRVEPGHGAPDDVSLADAYRNANKQRIDLDLANDRDRARLTDLLDEADLLVENLRAEERAALGLTPDAVSAIHPHLVHLVLADLGLSGPRSSWHLEALPALAASGALYASGFPELPPCNAPGHLAHDCASVYGAIGAVAAVLDRERRDDGDGQLVEVSVQEAALAGTTPWSIAMQDYLKINPLLPSAGTRNAEGAYWVLPAADGWVRVVIGSKRQWDGFVALMRMPDALLGDEWQNPGFRLANADVIRLVAQDRLTDRSRAELFEEALVLGTTIGVLHRVSEFVEHPQTKAHDYFVDAEVGGVERLPFATHPVTFSRTRRGAPGSAPDAGTRRRLRGTSPSGGLSRRP